MTTYFSSTVTCAICGQTSEKQVLGSTNSFGSPDLDLRPAPMQRFTMGTWVQHCEQCGYCATSISEAIEGAQEGIKQEEYQAVLKDERYPVPARHFLAFAALQVPTSLSNAARSRLHAAWVCDDERLAEQARECRKGAIECWMALWPFEIDESGATEGAVLVDALRRSEQFERAKEVCQTLLRSDSVEGTVRQVLEYQLGLIDNQDAQAHTIGDAVGDG